MHNLVRHEIHEMEIRVYLKMSRKFSKHPELYQIKIAMDGIPRYHLKKTPARLPVKTKVASKPIKTVGVLGRQRMVEEEIMRNRPNWGGKKETITADVFMETSDGGYHRIGWKKIIKLSEHEGRLMDGRLVFMEIISDYTKSPPRPIGERWYIPFKLTKGVDSDGDGVPDKFDCEPHNPEKQDRGEYSFSKANLYFYGVKMDVNGNKIGMFSFPDGRKFSIQTLGNLPSFHRIWKGDLDITQKMEKEVIDYIKKYGSSNQKNRLRTYN